MGIKLQIFRGKNSPLTWLNQLSYWNLGLNNLKFSQEFIPNVQLYELAIVDRKTSYDTKSAIFTLEG